MQNWSLKVKWTQPKPGNLLWARNVSGNWQSSNRAQLDAYQLNEIKACTFLKCWGRICRIDLWRWNEDNRSLATYCELETCRVIDNLPIALSLTHTNWMRSKAVCFWSVEAGYAELIFEGEMNSTEALVTYCELGNMSGNWQSSYRTHIHAHQFNAIKACTFLKCWGRICRIDLWRWNEHNRSLATYCELETCRVIDNLPIALSLTHTN